ncbi:bifunctional 3-(3-hydroxy-phenyl)propionate/3-hydroxycinnamic acid hydroxylase [Solimonas terrae]|uniref:Bifunctional 3-(3-hydroxy-phenyl)propionate/3-hydroxycinnamic acid hydroxylase n=1 Tax=Solimonas terrae TaxID=1396819 RepID=A0A6M2BLL4_9GAMM|nr:bifunctional 3-(3-hydroxy-phenyl)propionate/3-hydroxycinnamic acid hydroxylase [Solimonas terrae]NGY03314.1 bifunctional 3-(3-hydroxy-phenyl)propionate/3-hydroxycinnamic acid hydroxylase [Solimonas terrae]
MLPDSVDVLVVGYGPVGAALTALLGRYGVGVLVIDKAPGIYTAPRAIALDNDALRILQDVGVLEGFDRCEIPQVTMRSPYFGHFGTMDTSASINGHPMLVTFYQPQLEAALRRKAEGSASVTVACSTTLLGFSDEGVQVRATLQDARGTRAEVTCKFLIGVDGANSAVRKAIGQEFRGKSYKQDWLIVDAVGVPDNIDHVEFICDPRRPVPHMVAPGNRTRWEFMLAPGESREQMETAESIRRLLAPWPGTDKATIERKAVYQFQARSCEKYRKGRVFLAGDAAHVTPPFAGQGLISGLRDAQNLAWKLAAVISNRAAVGILDSYDSERRPHALAMIRLAKGLGSMIMPGNAFKAVIIHGFIKVLRLIPPVRRFLESAGPKPKSEYPNGLFVPGKGRLKRGGLLPQARLRDSNGSLLSDQFLGPHLTLMSFGSECRLDSEVDALWSQAHGTIVSIPAQAEFSHLDGWCAVIRPDRIVLHDGPAADASELARQSLNLMRHS